MCYKASTRDSETGDPARLPAQVARRWGLISEKVCDEENTIFVLEQPRQDKNLCTSTMSQNEPTKEGSLSFVLFESPFHHSFNRQQEPPLSTFSG